MRSVPYVLDIAGEPLTVAPRPHLLLDKLVLSGVKALLASAATQRLTVTASFNASEAPSLPPWVTSRCVCAARCANVAPRLRPAASRA